MDKKAYMERVAQVAPLLEKGMSQGAVSRKIGLSKSWTNRLIRMARMAGDLPPAPISKARILSAYDIRVGSLGPLFEEQTPEFKHWMAKQASGSVTLADVAMAALVDAYHEEQDQ